MSELEQFEPFLSAQEAVKKLAKYGIVCSPRTLLDGGKGGRVPSRKVNGRRVFRLSELLRHFESQAQIQVQVQASR